MAKFLLSLFALTWVLNSSAQVTLYAGPEYSGASIKVSEGSIAHMGNTIIGNDRLGSMVVPKGYMVTLYEHVNFRGYAETFNASALNLPPRLAGNVSSLVVTRENGAGWVSPDVNGQPGWNQNGVTIYSECYYNGLSNNMLPTNYPTMPANFHRRLSSIRIPAGYEVDLYTEAQYRGRVVRLRTDQACVPAEWNNIVASMKVYKNTSGFYPPDNYDPWNSNSGSFSVSGVTVFPQCDFKGVGTPLADGEYGSLPFGVQNRVYSIRIPQGKEVLLYANPNFNGPYMQLIGDRNCMASNLEYMVSSIKVRPFNSSTIWNGGVPNRPVPTGGVQEEVQAFNDCYYKGKTSTYKPGQYPALLFGFSNNISSIRVPANRRIILYTGVNYRGSSYILTGSNDCLMGAFNDRIRSLIVEEY